MNNVFGIHFAIISAWNVVSESSARGACPQHASHLLDEHVACSDEWLP